MRLAKRALAFLLVILTLSFSLLSLSSCSPETKEAVSFTDSIGNSVSLGSKPSRVAVLFSSLAQMWSLAGGEVAVSVAESVERGFCSHETPLVHSDAGGAGKTVNTELLIAEQPDFVICTADYSGQLELANLLEALGIPVAYFRIDSFSDYLSVFKIMTDITGNSEAYDRYGSEISNCIEKLLQNIPQTEKRVLFVRATRSSAKAKLSCDHFAANMLSELGAENIADKAPILLDGISAEVLLRENPDMIFISTMGDEAAAVQYINELFQRPEWAALDAVKNKNYVILSKELFQYKPCVRWCEAYEVLYGYLYE